MKKIVLFLALIGIGSTAYSETVYELSEPYCKAFEEIGGLAMKSRQANIALSKTTDNVKKIVNDSKEMTDHFMNIAIKITYLAYKKPVMDEIVDKDIEVSEFKNYVYMNCLPMMERELKTK